MARKREQREKEGLMATKMEFKTEGRREGWPERQNREKRRD